MKTETKLMTEKGITQDYVDAHEAIGYTKDNERLESTLKIIENLNYSNKILASKVIKELEVKKRMFNNIKMEDMDREDLEYYSEIRHADSIYLTDNLATCLYFMCYLSIENIDKGIFNQLQLGTYINSDKVA